MILSHLRAAFSRFFSALRGRNEVLAEFDEEWHTHVEALAEGYQRQGMSPEEAQREARLRVGPVTALREHQYEQAGFPFLDGLRQDLRYATRLMRKDWTFTLAVVLTLGVGIGVNTSVFTLVDALLLRSLPYHDPGRLISLHRLPAMTFGESKAKFNEWKRASTLLENAALFAETVACRAKEFSIRLVLGAQPRALLAGSVLGAIGWVLPGIILGVASAFTLKSHLASQIPGAHGWQPELMTALALGLLMVSALAGLIAAWRSATFDPARTLRTE